MASELENFGRRLEADPFFVAGPLKLYAQSEGLEDSKLASTLRCSAEALVLVRLCRAPAAEDESFQVDIERIAARYSVDAAILAQAIRRGQAILHMRRGESASNTLLAARDGDARKNSEKKREDSR